MSPLYGTGLYGTGRYGYDVPPDSAVGLARAVYGGAPPWLVGNRVTWRERQWALGTINFDHSWHSSLLGLSRGSERHISGQGVMLPQESLTLQIADPGGRYLEGGTDWDALRPDALVQVRTIVTTAAGSATWYGTVYRITQGLARTRDRWGRDVMQTAAEDWLRTPLQQPVGASRSVSDPLPPYPEPQPPLLGDDPVVEAGGAVIIPEVSPLGHALLVSGAMYAPVTSWLAVLQGCYSVLAGGVGWGPTVVPDRCTVNDGLYDGGPIPFATVPYLRLYDDWLAGSGGQSWAQVLESIQSRYGWQVQYGPGGFPYISAANERVNSGCVVSNAPTRGGSFPVPWENYSRQINRPQFTRVEYWADAPANIPWSGTMLSGSAQSTHPDFPHTPPGWKIDLQQGPDWNNVLASKRMMDYLTAADRITLAVDSACPIPPMNSEVRFYLPEDGLDFMYAISEATQPMGVDAGSWSLGWRGR